MSIQRQYNIEIGPFQNPPVYHPLTDVQTNLSYLQQDLMGDLLPIALLFSKHHFSTENYQSSAGQKSLWLVNIEAIHFMAFHRGSGQLLNIETTEALPAGTISHLSWDKEYLLQPEYSQVSVLIRPVNLTPPDAPDDDETPPLHHWGGKPSLWLPEARAPGMPGLLSRLHALTDT